MLDYDSLWSEEARRLGTPALAGLIQRFSDVSGVVKLAGGLPPAQAFPLLALSSTTVDGHALEVNRAGVETAQQYMFNTSGHKQLVAQVAQIMEHCHVVNCTTEPSASSTGNSSAHAAPGVPPRGIAITNGAIHAINAIISCLTSPGDTLILDEYTYTHALECVFIPRGLNFLTIRQDEQGMDPTHLRQRLEELQAKQQQQQQPGQPGQGEAEAAGTAPGCSGTSCTGLTAGSSRRRPGGKVLYVIPTGHNPTSVCMPLERKRELYKAAQDFNLLVLEDDAYYFLHYPQNHQQSTAKADGPAANGADSTAALVASAGGGASGDDGAGSTEGSGEAYQTPGLSLPRSFLSMDVDGRVVRIDTFSKVLGPGFRLGWITAPLPLIDKLAMWVSGSTVGAGSLSQVVVHELLSAWGLQGFDAHLRRLQGLYAGKAAVAHRAALQHLSGLATWAPCNAGMFMWFKLAHLSDCAAILDDLVEAKVVVVPGTYFNADALTAARTAASAADTSSSKGASSTTPSQAPGDEAQATALSSSLTRGCPYFRLSFASAPDDATLEEGFRRLGTALRTAQERHAKRQQEGQ